MCRPGILTTTLLDTPGQKVVKLRGVTHSFDGRCLIDNLTLQLGKDTRLGIIGANGTGKSTLFRLIGGDIKPDAGDVEIGCVPAVHLACRAPRAGVACAAGSVVNRLCGRSSLRLAAVMNLFVLRPCSCPRAHLSLPSLVRAGRR